MADESYDARAVETKWQRIWQERDPYRVDLDRAERPFYNLMEFPYPSAEGLHVGHTYTYGGADAYGRMMRMRGWDVFQPMGFDAFGIHSENYALKVGMNPADLVPRNVRRFREEQLKRMGAAFNWERQVDTTDPAYYRWTQWIFVQLFKAGLAYRGKRPVNWCPSCLTTLASEQVEEGRCERCHTAVVQKDLTQWFFRITRYADQLLDFSGAEFPDKTINLQRNWIGRKEGARITFAMAGRPETVDVFSTRADTLYGATFLALAPEHPLVADIVAPQQRAAVDAYVAAARLRTQVERLADAEAISGVYTGVDAIHPLDDRRLPVWVADYVLMDVGTGAIFGTPAHDARDMAFSRAHDLPVITVVQPDDSPLDASPSEAYEGPGVMINSGRYDGMTAEAARRAIVADLAERGIGSEDVTYRLHDWTISRQRYWGPPIPMLFCERCGDVPVPENDLPVLLPRTENYRPLGTGQSPLAGVSGFVEATCPQCGGPARRETDVSDNFLDSAWYFMRYLSIECHDRPWDVDRLRRWLPVDVYFGGPEHSTMHHLYARFLWKALQDLGHLPRDLGPEPFARLRLHGMIIREGNKMSKSRGNVLNPDDYVQRYGADVLRMFMLFIGPFEQGGDFRDAGISGMVRFVNRVWRMTLAGPADGSSPARPLVQTRHRMVRDITADIESLGFNTAIAKLMTFQRELSCWRTRARPDVWHEALSVFLRLLAPLAPHLTEELWDRVGAEYSIHRQPWPTYDADRTGEATITLVIQVNGKVRDRVDAPADLEEADARELALASEALQRALDGRSPRRIIYVPGRLVNVVC